MLRNQSLKQILADTRRHWDQDGTAPTVRQNFLKILACGTLALGAEIFSSETERLLVPHTCKSRACPSCGYRATTLWQTELEASLPDIYYAGINFTIPSFFWPLFQQNRHLLNDLPAVGASAIRRWAESKYGAGVFLIVVPQTLGDFSISIPICTCWCRPVGSRNRKAAGFPDCTSKERGTNAS